MSDTIDIPAQLTDDQDVVGATEEDTDEAAQRIVKQVTVLRKLRRERNAKKELAKATPEELAELNRLAQEEAEKARQAEEQKTIQAQMAAAARAAIDEAQLPPCHLGSIFGLQPEVRTPDGYRVTQDGVYISRQGFDGTPRWERIAFAPLVVSHAYTDADGSQSIELAWVDGASVVRRYVSRGVARRGRTLIAELGDAGLPVVEGDARAVERWLAEFEAANRTWIPSSYVAKWLGWQPDGSFISGPDTGAARVEVAFDSQRLPATAHRRGGSLAGWQAGVASVADLPVTRVVVAASLASALLRPLGLRSFTVDISSPSTRGKTTALQAGLSVWADPCDDAGALSTWRTTLIAVEKRLNLVRGIVTVLDESMSAENEEIISSVLYDLPKNQGKAREGGWASCLQWETILLSTGERPALSYSTHQGAAARVLSLTKPPFGEGKGRAAEALRRCVLDHHGHAGPAFVERVVAALQQPHSKDRLRERHSALTEQLRGTSDMTGRRAPMVAAVALAEELACGWGILPYEASGIEQWQTMFTEETGESDNRPEMAMDVVRAYVASNLHRLYRGTAASRIDQVVPAGGWIGLIVPATEQSPVQAAISPQEVRKILATADYSLDAVLDGWVAAGYLTLSKSQRPPHLIKKRLSGVQAKYLVFTPEAISLNGADNS